MDRQAIGRRVLALAEQIREARQERDRLLARLGGGRIVLEGEKHDLYVTARRRLMRLSGRLLRQRYGEAIYKGSCIPTESGPRVRVVEKLKRKEKKDD